MDKSLILQQLIDNAKKEHANSLEAAESVVKYNQSDDMKSEGKYDTRAIEAGYLAGAQQKRVEELRLEIQLLEEIVLKEFKEDDEIAIGALVELSLNDKEQYYFLSSGAGGTMLNIQGKAVMVISAFSPIGNELLGCKVGESFELETPKEIREYNIISVK